MKLGYTAVMLGVWLACAGCEGGAASADPLRDAMVLDAAPPDAWVDADVVPPDAAVSLCGAPDPLLLDGDRWVFEGDISGDDYACSCGGAGGADRMLQFTAPIDGRWRFHVIAAFDPVLSARADCVLSASEHACNDDVAFPRRQDAAVQVRLDAGETVYLVVDAYDRRESQRGSAFRLEAQRVATVGPGQTCDPLGLTDGCALGTACVGDHVGLIGGPGTCRTDAAPEIDDLWLHRDGPRVRLRIDGRDATADAETVRLQLYQGEARLQLGHEGEDTWVLSTELLGQTQFTTVHHAPLLLGNEAADAVEVWLEDARGHQSVRRRVALLEAPVVAEGARCDADRVRDRCVEGTACRAERCKPTAAPTVELASVFWSDAGPAFGLEVIGDDADGDVLGVVVAVFDQRGVPVGEANRRFDAVESRPDGGYRAVLSFAANPDLHFAEAALIVVDAEGQESAPTWVSVQGPAPVEAGAACDPVGARTTCPAELRCVGAAQPACAVPVVDCPADFAMAALDPEGEDRWIAAFDLWHQPDRGAASCGGGVGQVHVRFVPPVAGTYEAVATSAEPEADPVLSARAFCADAAPWSERACNDDRAAGERTAALRLRLGAQEPVWLVVDGYRGPEGWWAGAGTITVRRVE